MIVTLTDEKREAAQRAAMLLDRVPTDTWVELHDDELRFQASSQAAVREVRRRFPGVFWTKEWAESCGWWTYRGEFRGVRIHIYAVSEAPPTCHAVEETVEVEEPVMVPTGETRKVTRTKLKWICADGERVAE